MGQNKTQCSSRFNTWSFVLLNLYKWSSKKKIADPSELILFADDTSIIITNPNSSKFKEDINNTIDNINVWFRGNTSTLYFDKIYFLQFRPKNNYEINIKISCDNKPIKETKSNKFLRLDIDNSLWMEKPYWSMMIKLSTAYYAIRYVKHFMSQDKLRTI